MPRALTSNPIAVIQTALQSGRITLNSLEFEGGIAVDMQRENFVTLNATATAILEALIAGASDAARISESLCEKFDVTEDVARKCVDEFLQQFAGYLVTGK